MILFSTCINFSFTLLNNSSNEVKTLLHSFEFPFNFGIGGQLLILAKFYFVPQSFECWEGRLLQHGDILLLLVFELG